MKFLTDGERVELDTSKIISIGGEGIILVSGNYKYDLKKGDDGFDENKEKMNGTPICTKYTLNTRSSDIIYHFDPELVTDERMPPEYFSSKINSDCIIKNVEIYFCKTQHKILIGTGDFFKFLKFRRKM